MEHDWPVQSDADMCEPAAGAPFEFLESNSPVNWEFYSNGDGLVDPDTWWTMQYFPELRSLALPLLHEEEIKYGAHGLEQPYIPESEASTLLDGTSRTDYTFDAMYPSQFLQHQMCNNLNALSDSEEPNYSTLPSSPPAPLVQLQDVSLSGSPSDGATNAGGCENCRCHCSGMTKDDMASILAWHNDKGPVLDNVITWSKDVTRALEIIARCCMWDRSGTEQNGIEDSECFIELLSMFNLENN